MAAPMAAGTVEAVEAVEAVRYLLCSRFHNAKIRHSEAALTTAAASARAQEHSPEGLAEPKAETVPPSPSPVAITIPIRDVLLS